MKKEYRTTHIKYMPFGSNDKDVFEPVIQSEMGSLITYRIDGKDIIIRSEHEKFNGELKIPMKEVEKFCKELQEVKDIYWTIGI